MSFTRTDIDPAALQAVTMERDMLREQADRYRQALERIAHDDGDPDGIVRAQRQVAQEALNA